MNTLLQPIALEHPATLVYAYVTMATANSIGALGDMLSICSHCNDVSSFQDHHGQIFMLLWLQSTSCYSSTFPIVAMGDMITVQ